MGRYGARVNVHLLGLFHKTANSRWDLAVSPHIYMVTTKADIQTITDDAKVMKGSTNWHLGYGADLLVGYQLTSCLKLGIYSGLTRLTGERMDGMPEHLHKNNFVWESGVRLNDILKTLKENPNMKVTVTGWCDTKGSVAVNKRISRQRAEAVKTWLAKNGIEASRITAIGNGSDGTQDADKARRVETTDNHQ